MDDREDLKQTMIFVTFLLLVGLVTAVCIVELVLYYESKKCNCDINTEEQKQIYEAKIINGVKK